MNSSLLSEIYRALYWRSRKSIRNITVFLCDYFPLQLLLSEKSKLSDLSIGITTYEERYEKYFKPLLLSLKRIFPYIKIVVAVNGIEDQVRQKLYLKRLNDELGEGKNVKFIKHTRPEGLSSLWNEIMVATETTYVLMLNDDLVVNPCIKRWLNHRKWEGGDLMLMNASWSHYVITRDTYKEVGPFDEGYVGIGFEDIDYEARMALKGKKISNIICWHIKHKAAIPKKSSYTKYGQEKWEKYTSQNFEYFSRKWTETTEEEGVIYARQLKKWIKWSKKVPLCSL